MIIISRHGTRKVILTYRPICLLNEARKLMERVIVERLRKHLDEVDGISPEQFGFRRRRSTPPRTLFCA